jgi:hypothetical protein
MIEGPEVEAHHHHKTGHSKLDLIFASLAVVLSLVSVMVALHHGKTMERLVEANTWPNLSYDTGNLVDDGHTQAVTLSLMNTGVGPARIENFEVFYKDQPVADGAALMKACCGLATIDFSSSQVTGEVLPARDRIDFIEVPKAENPALFDVLNKERFKIRVRACYCSVFDDCYVLDTKARRPERVAQCSASQGLEYHQ